MVEKKNNNGVEYLFSDLEKDPEFQEAMEELEPGYQITRLRMKKDLTQAQLAELIGTSQSAIARLENGSAPSLSNLRRVAKALGAHVKVYIISDDCPEDESQHDTALLNTIKYLHEKIYSHVKDDQFFDAQQVLTTIINLIEECERSKEYEILTDIFNRERVFIDLLAQARHQRSIIESNTDAALLGLYKSIESLLVKKQGDIKTLQQSRVSEEFSLIVLQKEFQTEKEKESIDLQRS